jgi:uncharacterized protein (TIGR03546 family)
MIPLIGIPVKIVKLFTKNESTGEVAAGVCMGMFMGFIPLNGPMAILLFALLFIFKINRLASILVLPLFKLFYVLGVSLMADKLGGLVLINMEFMAPIWRIITHLPLLALLDLNNTLVAGGLLISGILCFPAYVLSKKGIVVLREKYFAKIQGSKFVRWFLKLPLISQIVMFVAKVKGVD